MRSFSGLYFFLIIFMYFCEVAVRRSDYFKPFVLSGTLFLIAALTVALIKPYRKTENNKLDSLLLANIAIIFTVLCADISKLLILNILLFVPFAAMILFLLQSKLYKVSHDHCSKRTLYNCLQNCNTCHCLKKTTESSLTDSDLHEQSLILPNADNIDIAQYGAC